jgi:hypothetical protein
LNHLIIQNKHFLMKTFSRLLKSPAQILIRWSVQHGFITIPKTSQDLRLKLNADVFNWSIPDEAMDILVINWLKYEFQILFRFLFIYRMLLAISNGRVHGIRPRTVWKKLVLNKSFFDGD